MIPGGRAGPRFAATALALLLAGTGDVAAAPTGPVISEVRLGTADGHLVIDVFSSALLKYALVEGPGEPFTLTFYLLDAVYAFPAAAQDIQEGSLRQLVATVLEREESRLARLDLVFDRAVQYRIVQNGGRLAIHVGEPGTADRVVLRAPPAAPSDASPPAETPRAVPAPAAPKRAPPAATAAAAPNPPGAPPTASAAGPASPAPAAVPPAAPPPPGPSVPVTSPVAPAPAAAAPMTGLLPPAPVAARTPGPSTPVPVAPASPAPAPPAARVAPAAPTPPRPATPPPTVARVAPPAARPTRILGLSRVDAEPQTAVRVHADGRLMYRAFTLSGPDRVVVDFDGAALAVSQQSLVVGGPLLDRVRASRFRTPSVDVVRVVLDLKRAVPYWIESLGTGVIVHLGSQGPTR